MSKADDMKARLEAQRKAKEKGDPRVTHFTGEKQNTKAEKDDIKMTNNAIEAAAPWDLDAVPDKKERSLVGIYFDPDVKLALEKVNRKKGRGAKSEFVNNVTRWALKQQGYL